MDIGRILETDLCLRSSREQSLFLSPHQSCVLFLCSPAEERERVKNSAVVAQPTSAQPAPSHTPPSSSLSSVSSPQPKTTIFVEEDIASKIGRVVGHLCLQLLSTTCLLVSPGERLSGCLGCGLLHLSQENLSLLYGLCLHTPERISVGSIKQYTMQHTLC